MAEGGLYIAVFSLQAQRWIQVGRLGRFEFAPGFYFYVGSAQGNLAARLARHGRREKALRWHVDYLSTEATMIGAMIVPGSREGECTLAAQLGRLYGLAVPRFGASDCRCGGHLFYASAL